MNSYEDAHAKAYKLLDLVVEKLGDVDYHIIRLIRWEWDRVQETRDLRFIVRYKHFYFIVTKHYDDLFDDEWYESAAEEIAAWLLLQRDVSRGSNTRR